jgi:2-oxoglutarate ferredoxin oxidoreductase subunit delta
VEKETGMKEQANSEKLKADSEQPIEHKQYEIDIFRDWCKGCGICAEFCPKKCLRLNEAGEPVVDRTEACTGCGWCEMHCPDFAICVRQLAAKTKAEDAD